MPGGDGTGPWGYGSRTGRGLGYCAGYGAPGSMNPYFPAWGRGRGFGGRGRRWWWRGNAGYPYPPAPRNIPYSWPRYGAGYGSPSPEEERTYLEGLASSLEEELKGIKERLKALAAAAEK